MTVLSVGATLRAENWPSLPQGVRNGVSGRIGDQLYVGLGSAGASLYALEFSDPARGWRELAPFPGPATEDAAFATAGGRLFVFSGVGKIDADALAPVVLTCVHAYDPGADCWQRIDTEAPVGLLGASAHALDEDRIVLFGGVNKEVFDDFVSRHARANAAASSDISRLTRDYLGMAPEDYRWNKRVLVYAISTNSWSDLGESPFPPNAGAALVAQVDGSLLIHGEIKPGLRGTDVRRIRFQGGLPVWSRLPVLPPRPGEDRQEGLAGAFAGYADGVLLVAGGTNFAGSQANAAAGRWYAHEGLTKRWNAEIYAFADGKWTIAGALPEGLAFGASFTLDQGLLLVGGQDRTMSARREVHLLRWTGSRVEVFQGGPGLGFRPGGSSEDI